MARFIVARLGQAFLTLVGILIVLFVLFHLVPGSPAYALVGHDRTHRQVAIIKAQLGLNLPTALQLTLWMKGMAMRGRFIATRLLPRTLQLLLWGLGIAMILAVVVAMVQVRYPGSFLERIVTAVTYFFYAVPGFWLALLLIYIFSLWLLWLPTTGTPSLSDPGSYWSHQILPVATLALTTMGGWSRSLRVALEEALQEDYVRTARAKGVSEGRVVLRHAFKNSWLPLLTLLGMSLPTVLNTVIAIEAIFAIPGLGAAFLQNLGGLFFESATSIAFFLALLTVLGSVVADVLYGWADPRIQYR